MIALLSLFALVGIGLVLAEILDVLRELAEALEPPAAADDDETESGGPYDLPPICRHCERPLVWDDFEALYWCPECEFEPEQRRELDDDQTARI